WNRTQKIVRGGTKRQRRRPTDEWVTLPTPELRIVSDELWASVHTRLAAARPWFARMQRGDSVTGRPTLTESAYLLTGFAACAECRGSLATIGRMHGTPPHRRLVRFYGCTIHEKRGNSVCTNRVVLRHETLNHAILSAISEALDEDVVTRAIAK